MNAPPPAKEPLSPMRVVFAAIGILIMLFAGGCSLFFLSVLIPYGGAEPFLLVMAFGAPGLLAGLAIYLLAVRWGREKMVPPE